MNDVHVPRAVTKLIKGLRMQNIANFFSYQISPQLFGRIYLCNYGIAIIVRGVYYESSETTQSDDHYNANRQYSNGSEENSKSVISANSHTIKS